MQDKLSPRYIGPYEIVSKVGPIAYRLKLPQSYQGFMTHSMCRCKEIHPSSFTCVERTTSVAKGKPDL